MTRRAFAAFLVLAVFAASALAQDRVIDFPDIPGYRTFAVDLHIHSVFSDGAVWPDIRVQEAVRDGLDLLAVTEHLEYQPHLADIPHPDRNRSFEIASRVASRTELILVNGAEITRSMPPGHTNAVFLDDANALLTPASADYLAGRRERLDNADVVDAFRAANDQGAFVFWNHPSWTGHEEDGIAKIAPLHLQLIEDGLLHGIEVANGQIYSAEALQLALDLGLTVVGVSDVHGLIDWDYDVANGGQRTSTLVFAEGRTADSIQAALRAGRTLAWMDNTLIGREEHMAPLLHAALTVAAVDWRPNSRLVEVTIANGSSARFELRKHAGHNLYDRPSIVTVPPHGSVTIALAGETRSEFALEFEVLNAIVAPNTHASVSLPVTVPALE